MAKKKVVKKKVVKKKTKKAKKKTEPVDLVSCERELRNYVKRSGGLRKGISDAGKKRVLQLMKLLSRKEIIWDENIIPVTESSRKRKLI